MILRIKQTRIKPFVENHMLDASARYHRLGWHSVRDFHRAEGKSIMDRDEKSHAGDVEKKDSFFLTRRIMVLPRYSRVQASCVKVLKRGQLLPTLSQ
jgi:hypothetical protein